MPADDACRTTGARGRWLTAAPAAGWRWLDDLAHDVRVGARTLLRTPGFALTAVLTLGLAAGATTAIFGVLNAVVLQPLPFARPDALVQVHGRSWGDDRPGTPSPVAGRVGSAQLLAFSEEATRFSGFAGYAVTTVHLVRDGRPERLTAVRADPNLFGVLGTAPAVGRTFGPGDAPDGIVISAALWRREFGGARDLPGTRVQLDGRGATILGVMPDAFQFPYGASATTPGALPESRTDVWLPLAPIRTPGSPDGLRRGRVDVVARLKDGVPPASAEAELRAISARLEERQTGTPRLRFDARVVPVRDEALGTIRRSLWLLLAAAGLVLAAACANVANLMLARLSVRLREIATRAALGAGRARLARLFLVESLALSLAGGMLGVAVAYAGTRLFTAIGAATIPRSHEIALDWSTFGFLLGACLVTALLFGVAPAAAAARVDPHSVSRAGGTSTTAGRGVRHLRNVLVVAQVALAFLLASGAAWVVYEVLRLSRLQPGMATANVVTLHVTPRAAPGDYTAIERRVAALPGVAAAGFTQLLPLQNWGWDGDFTIEGEPPGPARLTTGLRYVTPGYFGALQIPLLRGRLFADTDAAGSPAVVLVNDAFARRFFPDRDPIGRVLDRGTIVGVVGDVRQVSLDRPAEPELYYAAAQNVTMASDLGMTLVVRTRAAPTGDIQSVRGAIREVNPNLAVFHVKTMEQVLADSMWRLHLYRWLVGAFAALVLVLAAVGLYGVLAYAAAAQSREFAIRLALGSTRGGLAGRVLASGLRLTLAGLLLGAAAVALASAAAPAFGIEVRAEPLAAVTGAATLVLLALAACCVPAARVAAVNPAAALRQE